MKCKDCSACHKGWFNYRPNDYVCTGVKEPFIISDINVECTEYEYNRDKILPDAPLSCPFCGGEPEIQHWSLTPYERTLYEDDGYWWSVFCKYCFAEGGSHLSKEEAVAVWNRRV